MKNSLDLLLERKAQIKLMITELKSELRTIEDVEPRLRSDLGGAATPHNKPLRRGRGSSPTIKDLVLGVLKEKDGIDANEIAGLINSKHGLNIKRESLSPQLSRLKNYDKKIELRNNFWYLVKAEELSAPTSAASKARGEPTLNDPHPSSLDLEKGGQTNDK